MAVRKKTIELLLLDGTVIGCIKYTLKGWIGVAYKIPRTELKNYEKREQLNYSGVYFLFGKNDEDNKNVVYVGQACSRKNGKGVLNRLQEHTRNPEKDYWSEAIIITTSNNSFGPTEISFLENYFTTLAIKANRYRVKNGNEPPLGNLTEEKECELEEFADYVKIAVGVLGHKVFIPLSEPPLDSKDGNKEETLLFLKRSTANAIGRCTSDGFVVLKGSKIVENPTRSCPKFVKDFRKKNQKYIDVNFCLTEDVLFASPSGSASFVVYGSANGNVQWKTEKNISPKDLEKSENQEKPIEPPIDESLLYLKTSRAKATCRVTKDGFVVLKGSKIAENPTNSCRNSIKNLRKKYANKMDSDFCLKENLFFKSPSGAAAFVVYGSANGNVLWKSKDNVPLKNRKK